MSSLRITSGTLRGRRVPVPAGDVRPTSERARQAYFNIVGDRIENARFLDLFTGSGIFAFEALSRGAASATAVDLDKWNFDGIAKQSATLGVPVRTLAGDVITVLKRLKEPFDLVYADPPYDYSQYQDLVRAIGELPLAPDAIVAAEHRRGSAPFEENLGRLRVTRRAEYSEVWITFFALEKPAT
ncbi:MAG TPA: RsmD family RNA methyltransferase [Thermoanaerobaculia bacterium]